MTITIISDKSIKEIVENDMISSYKQSKTSNLDGDHAIWFTIANLAITSAPHIFNFIIKLKETSGVKKIKVGDVEIENPTVEMVEKLLAEKQNEDENE